MLKNLKDWFSGLVVKQMLNSKKFWYAVMGVLTTILSDALGLNPEEVSNILISIGALILGQGFADMKKK
tara:strand:- start:452 stop:658 length:207 start_codon:yes stop_codon:yes gene_type:complete